MVSLAGLAAMPLGLWVLTRAPERALTAVIAVVLLVSTAVVARGLTLDRAGPPRSQSGPPAGCC